MALILIQEKNKGIKTLITKPDAQSVGLNVVEEEKDSRKLSSDLYSLPVHVNTHTRIHKINKIDK